MPNDLESELRSKEKENVRKIKQLEEEKSSEHGKLKQQIVTMENELIEIREKVESKENQLREYKEIFKEAERKYEENQKQIEALRKDNEELNNNMGLLKRALKVTEDKIKSKQESEKDNDMETPNIEDMISNKNSGYERPNPQSNSEPKKLERPMKYIHVSNVANNFHKKST